MAQKNQSQCQIVDEPLRSTITTKQKKDPMCVLDQV